MRKLSKHLILAFLVLGIAACNKEKTTTLVIDNIAIGAEGPLFEGANTAQGEVQNQLQNFAKENGIELSAIQSAKLKTLSLSVDDTSDFNLYSSISVQLASDKAEMVEVAAINSIQPGSKKLDLTVATEKNELIETLRQDKFTVVVDAIMTKDSNMNIAMKGRMEIEIKY
jgi:hypothetical protein